MGTDGHRKRKLLLFIVASVLAVLLVLCYLPTLVHKSRTYECAVCGAHRTKGIRYLFGIPYGKYERPPSRSHITTQYHRLIGLPHRHEWIYTARAESRGSVLGGRRESTGGVHPFRMFLLRRVLQVIETDFKDFPKEFRQQLFQRLIRCESFGEFYEILEEEKARREDAASNGANEEGSYHEDEGTDQ